MLNLTSIQSGQSLPCDNRTGQYGQRLRLSPLVQGTSRASLRRG